MTTPRPNVLLLTPQPFFQWRGSPIRVSFDVQAMVDNGFAVDLLAMPVGEDRVIEGAALHRVPNVLGVKNLPIGPSLAKAVLDVFLFFKAWGMMRRKRYVLVHGVEEAGFLALLLGRMHKAGVVFEKHSDPDSYKKGTLRNFVMWLYSQVERFTMRRADAVIGTGPGLVEQSHREAPGVPAFHIPDIPSSLEEPDSARVTVVRKELQKHSDEVLVTYVGSFAVYQGIELMFEAVPQVLKSAPDVRFVIIGGSSAEIEERKRQLEEQGCADRVSMIGKVPPDDLPNYLAASDILLSPRLAGTNTPLKLLDYLKAGRSIVATDNKANRLILDETRAVLVQPTADSLAGGIRDLAADPGRREALGAKGRILIEETYNYSVFRDRLAACYAQVLGA